MSKETGGPANLTDAPAHIPTLLRVKTLTFDKNSRTVVFSCPECKAEQRHEVGSVGRDQWYVCDGRAVFLHHKHDEFPDLCSSISSLAKQPQAVDSAQQPLADTLRRLDGYMEHLCYGDDHPWRAEIAAALAAAGESK